MQIINNVIKLYYKKIKINLFILNFNLRNYNRIIINSHKKLLNLNITLN